MSQGSQVATVSFAPEIRAEDPLARHWMRQATLRLRREICWRWHLQDGEPPSDVTRLPSPIDSLSESLDLAGYAETKRQFFESDVTARYLSQQLHVSPPAPAGAPRGSFVWVADALELDDTACFVLALALLSAMDNAVGPVIAACLNQNSQHQPTLGLAQKLWSPPDDLLDLGDPAHALWRSGVLQRPLAGERTPRGVDWDAVLTVPGTITRQLVLPESDFPQVLRPLQAVVAPDGLQGTSALIAEQLKPVPRNSLRIVPLCGTRGVGFTDMVLALARVVGRDVRRVAVDSSLLEEPGRLRTLATLAWLKGVDLLIQTDSETRPEREQNRLAGLLADLRSIPVTVYVAIEDPGDLAHLPRDLLFPTLEVPVLDYAQRVATWTRLLGSHATGLGPAIADCARRFRYEKQTIATICARIAASSEVLGEDGLAALCRAEMPLDMGELAQLVEPRFTEDELILPHAQERQFDEIYRAMKALTEVHYGWGTAKVWNHSGISVLFTGAPGTGKTMAAEVLAKKLDMPLYRIDLSQVVNKYIGETEKNLKRLFDVADVADTILFFDEADALFGRRTEVKDAHDRYANLEISYLLERMERFKGLAILATNRRKDLDEAFLRRLREIIEFPMPDVAERKAIWHRVIPDNVDASALDFDFLAARFPLAGGHIRSIVFNACLQAAGSGKGASAGRKLTMENVAVAVKREYDKLNRSVSLEQFGPYANRVEALKHG